MNIKYYYRHFLKTANLINNYNFKHFAIRKIKHDFRVTQSISINTNKLDDELAKLKRINTIYMLNLLVKRY